MLLNTIFLCNFFSFILFNCDSFIHGYNDLCLAFFHEISGRSLNGDILMALPKRIIFFFFISFVLFKLSLKFPNFRKVLHSLFFIKIHLILNLNKFFFDQFLHFLKMHNLLFILCLYFLLFSVNLLI